MIRFYDGGHPVLPLFPSVHGVSLEHFVLHGLPNHSMKFDKVRQMSNFRHIARTGYVDHELSNGASGRASREDDDAIRQRYRLLEIMRHECYRLTIRRPK